MAYSYVTYIADGATSTFAVPFTLQRRDELRVYVDGVLIASNTYVLNTAGTSVTLGGPPALAAVVEVGRSTLISPDNVVPVQFQAGTTYRAQNINKIVIWLLHLVQEARDKANDALGLIASRLSFTARNKEIRDVGAPTQPNSAVRLADLAAIQVQTGNLPPITPFDNRSMLVALNSIWTVLTVPSILASLGVKSAGLLDVGTTALKVVQLDAAGKLPAVDGSNLTNLPIPPAGPGVSILARTIRYTTAQILNNTAVSWFSDSGGSLGRLDITAAQPVSGDAFMGANVTLDTTLNTFTIVNDGTYEIQVEAVLGNKDSAPSANVEFRITNQAGTTLYQSSVYKFGAKTTGADASEKMVVNQSIFLPAGASIGTYAIKARHDSAGGNVWAFGEGTRVTIRKLA